MRKSELGQHFLRSPRLALMLIGHSNIKKRDLVIDIGAGSGVITSALAKRCREVWAVEPDAETAEVLEKNVLRGGKAENVRMIREDFLEMDLPAEPYKVFANPPFVISSAILKKLVRSDNPPEAIYLILQKNLALKLIMTDRHYTSQLGHEINAMYQTKIRYPLRRTDFTPPPGVDTVLWEAKRIVSLPET